MTCEGVSCRRHALAAPPAGPDCGDQTPSLVGRPSIKVQPSYVKLGACIQSLPYVVPPLSSREGAVDVGSLGPACRETQQPVSYLLLHFVRRVIVGWTSWLSWTEGSLCLPMECDTIDSKGCFASPPGVENKAVDARNGTHSSCVSFVWFGSSFWKS